MIEGHGMLLRAKSESFKDEAGKDVAWLDVAVLVDTEVVNGSGTPDCLDGLNGSREDLDAGKPVPVSFTATLRQGDNYGRKFKVKFTDFSEV